MDQLIADVDRIRLVVSSPNFGQPTYRTSAVFESLGTAIEPYRSVSQSLVACSWLVRQSGSGSTDIVSYSARYQTYGRVQNRTSSGGSSCPADSERPRPGADIPRTCHRAFHLTDQEADSSRN